MTEQLEALATAQLKKTVVFEFYTAYSYPVTLATSSEFGLECMQRIVQLNNSMVACVEMSNAEGEWDLQQLDKKKYQTADVYWASDKWREDDFLKTMGYDMPLSDEVSLTTPFGSIYNKKIKPEDEEYQLALRKIGFVNLNTFNILKKNANIDELEGYKITDVLKDFGVKNQGGDMAKDYFSLPFVKGKYDEFEKTREIDMSGFFSVQKCVVKINLFNL